MDFLILRAAITVFDVYLVNSILIAYPHMAVQVMETDLLRENYYYFTQENSKCMRRLSDGTQLEYDL